MMSAFVPLLIAAIIIASIGFCNSQCVLHEREALFKLKRSFIDDQGILASWNDDTDCCSWSGIVCNNFTGHVLQLHLQGFDGDHYGNGYLKLSGDINESLLELKHLKYLDLSHNNFGISIPEFFGFMSSLRFLNLSVGGFRGNIPNSIGNLTSLVTLDLSYNYFTGEIPHELGNLSSLQYLSIGPDLFHPMKSEKLDWISRLSSLKFLNFRNVHFSKSSDWANSLGKLPSLQQLLLSMCQLIQIPPLSNLSFPSLTYLDLSFNLFEPFGFTTSIASLQNLTSLRSLVLSYNSFNSSIPDNWFNGFTQLKLLDLRFNELYGFIPSSIGNLTSLVTLDLSENNFIGKNPKSFINLCNLRLLSLSSNRMSQEVNEVFEILSCTSDKLESLHFPNSRLSGYLSDVLNKFKSFVSLDLSNNSIVGPLPLSFGEMASLTYLDLSHNKLNGSLPSIFGRLESVGPRKPRQNN